MLGIGQIATRIAELIPRALPYAIVNNNPEQSLFSRLVSYRDVQPALDAGWKWIKVTASDVDYNAFTITTAKTRIDSCWGARFTNINTAAGQHVVAVSANHCNLTGLNTYTPGGETSNDRRGYSILGAGCLLIGCRVEDSDGSGFMLGASGGLVGTDNRLIGCVVDDADDFGFYTNTARNSFLGCTAYFTSGTNCFYVNGANFSWVGNHSKANMAIDSGGTNGIAVGNLIDGSITDGGSGNLLTSSTYNEEY